MEKNKSANRLPYISGANERVSMIEDEEDRLRRVQRKPLQDDGRAATDAREIASGIEN